MLLDWFTVVSQALNFLILIWLMKRFLYKPILGAIDAREKKISVELTDADARKAEAKQENEKFQAKNLEFDQERSEIIAQATQEGESERQRILEEARGQAKELSEKRQKSLKDDQIEMMTQFRRKAKEEIFSIARKTLQDLAGTPLEEKILETFVAKIKSMKTEEREDLKKSIAGASSVLVIRSAFELSAEQKQTLSDALQDLHPANSELQYKTDPDKISGIELTTNGQRVTWNIEAYLRSFEMGMEEYVSCEEKDS